jgi:hypothetical protein
MVGAMVLLWAGLRARILVLEVVRRCTFGRAAPRDFC